MTPHGKRPYPSPSEGVESTPPSIPLRAVSGNGFPSSGGESEAEHTLKQLEAVLSEFMIKYPSHTQRIPSIREGEHPMISFVRTIVSSMASKQEQLEQLNAEVMETAKEKERFLANMSHEVRTPMNGIFGMVNLLREMDLDPVQKEYLDTIHGSSESLLNILDDILDYSKLNSNEMQLRPREFDLSKLIRDVLWTYKSTADSKDIELSATICDSLPDDYIADDLRLKQVLSNLVSNAIKFTDDGTVSVTVQSIQKSGREQLLFQVADSGIGIKPDAAKNLFTPFRQIDSEDDRRYAGTGLGLAISKNLIELMGGRVWFESESGIGTTFYFSIDYEESSNRECAQDDIVSRGKLQQAPTTSRRSKLRVLLVEDNKVNQKVASLTLEKLGCDVTIANHGGEAVDLADGPVDFDIIFMDVNMPVMNGLEATKLVRKLDHSNSRIPIIAMTGMAFEEDREHCLEAGMNDVVTKPFEISDLRSKLEALTPENVALSA